MSINFKQFYKVNKNAVQQSFEKQMGLKNDIKYEKWANEATIQLIEYFISNYKGVKIEIPKLREKSPKSLLGKIKNLQIERLSKLYALDDINQQDKQALYTLIKERMNENSELDIKNILNEVRGLIFTDDINVQNFEKIIMIDGISKSTKTALIRLLVRNLERSSNENKKEIFKYLDSKYGEERACQTGFDEDNIIKYNSIVKLRNNPEKIKRLEDENQFLKANDLRGMKIVVAEISDDFKTNNEVINELLQKRKCSKTDEEKRKITHLITVEIGKEFYNNLVNDEQLLKKLNVKVIPDSNKHKIKSNGYEAEHIKFYNITEPEYTLEMQFKSEYIENIAKGEGSAAHQNRPGKKRVLPHAANAKELAMKLEFMVPKYTTFRIKDGHVVAQKQDMLKNVLSYFEGHIDPSMEQYEQIIDLYKNNNEKEIAM